MKIILTYKLILIVSFIFSLLLKKNCNSSIKYFELFLGISLILDAFIGSLFIYLEIQNAWIYNILILIQVPYFLYLFLSYFKGSSDYILFKRIIWGVVILSIINFLFIQGPTHVNNFSYLLGMSVLCILIVKYYYSLLLSEVSVSLFRLPLFWLSIGILLFFTASFPILAYLNIIIDSNSMLTEPLYDLVGIGNIFLSLSYLMVILCPWMIQKS
ncbi:MAG: hypothetical protein WBO44_15675 [Saprospiraceae bacterium]